MGDKNSKKLLKKKKVKNESVQPEIAVEIVAAKKTKKNNKIKRKRDTSFE
jgi:hypothetical protein